MRNQQDFDAGKVGKTAYSGSWENLPIGRPKRVFDGERVIELRRKGPVSGKIAKQLGFRAGAVNQYAVVAFERVLAAIKKGGEAVRSRYCVEKWFFGRSVFVVRARVS